MTLPNAMREALDMRGCVIRLRGSRTGYQAVSVEIADLVKCELGDGVTIICSYEEGTCILSETL